MDFHLSCAREIYFTFCTCESYLELLTAHGKWRSYSFSACWFRECFIDRGAIAQVPMLSQMYSEKYTESSAAFTLCTCALPTDLILNSEMIMEENNFLLSPQRKIKKISIQTMYLKHMFVTETIRDCFPEVNAVNIAVNSLHTATTCT